MTARWPTNLYPSSCMFGRSRNPAVQTSAASGHAYEWPRGQPLWTAQCTFEITPAIYGEFVDTIETADGMRVPWLVHDFANPWPCLDSNIQRATGYVWAGTSAPFKWIRTATRYNWIRRAIDYSALSPAVVFNTAAGSYSIIISGFTAYKMTLVRGDLIEIDERLYMLQRSIVSDASGRATLILSTPLLALATAASVVKIVKPACVMRVDSHTWSSQRPWNDPMSSATLKFVEVPVTGYVPPAPPPPEEA